MIAGKTCFRISERAVTRLPDGRWRVNATGEELRPLPSYDGEIWRCACDRDADGLLQLLLQDRRLSTLLHDLTQTASRQSRH